MSDELKKALKKRRDELARFYPERKDSVIEHHINATARQAFKAGHDSIAGLLIEAAEHIEDCLATMAEVSPATTMVSTEAFLTKLEGMK